VPGLFNIMGLYLLSLPCCGSALKHDYWQVCDGRSTIVEFKQTGCIAASSTERFACQPFS
jgi:hypothetical protein